MEYDEIFQQILKQYKKDICPNCGKIIDRGDLCWNNPSTDAGTDYCVVEIQCQQCDTEIAHGHSWYPGADNFEELVNNVLEDILDNL